MNDIGKILKELRKESGYTQSDIADKLDVAKSAVSFWENNVHKPNSCYIERLSAIYGISSDYILGIEDEFGNRIADGKSSFDGSNRLERHLKAKRMPLDALNELSDEELSALVTLAKAMVNKHGK